MRDSSLSHTMPMVVIVEDDRPHRALLSTWLKQEGFRIEAFENGLVAKTYLEEQWADLLLLDWDVPGMSGDRLLRWVRSRTHSPLPVIFQTVHGTDEDIIGILDAGADDYIVKPVDRALLLARVRALLRRYHPLIASAHTIPLGNAILDQKTQSIRTEHGVIVTLGVKEFDIAWYLASHRGNVVLRQELLRAVWGIEADIETRSVDMYVSRLRTKLSELGTLDWQIQSVYGHGYRLNVMTEKTGE